MSTFCQRVTVRIGVVFTVVVLSVAGSLLTRTAAWASQTQTDVNARDADGMTPLDYAVEQNDIGSVLALIHAGADVNARSNTGRTALSWAALHGYIEIARALAQAGADLNVKDAQGGTPFTLAFEAGHFEVVQALIKAGADADPSQVRKDVNAQDGSGDTPLVHAAKRGDIASIRALVQLEAGANADSEGPAGWSALMQASYFGRLGAVRVLIPGTNVNYRAKNGITALMLARWACQLEIVEALTRVGAVLGSEEWRRAPGFADFPISRIYKGVPAP